MRFVVLPRHASRAALRRSVRLLDDTRPDMSAGRVLSGGQQAALALVVTALVAGAVVAPLRTGIVVVGLFTFLYVVITLDRALLFTRSRRPGNTEVVTDEQARAFPDGDLPRYSVLVPAYREPEVIGRLIGHLEALEYPRDRLEILLLLEGDDAATIDAVRAIDPGPHFRAVLVPPTQPRTKPKALNFALSVAHGDVVCIYDVEDQPEPLQLRRAAVALHRLPRQVACLQAKLSFANAGQNLITRWFTIEYAMWFDFLLPGLHQLGAPLPLGGTSNHFRREILDELGAWDAHNVTEDADLGIRLSRLGYRCGVLESVTLEEANSDFVNWVKQRSRWYKGYLQTVLIHLRRPRELRRQLGWAGAVQFALFVGGTPLLAFLNPLFWVMTAVWFLGGRAHLIQELFPAPVFYPATTCWVFGNFLVAYLTLLTCRLVRRPELGVAAMLVPVYWVMMSVGAVKAVYQLVVSPSFWEKTTHGLDERGDRPVDRPVDRTAVWPAVTPAILSPAVRRSAPTA